MVKVTAPTLTGPNPTPAQLDDLSQFFEDIETNINNYTGSPEGQNDPNLAKITQLALTLGTAATNIATAALNFQVSSGQDPVIVINGATAKLQTAINTRNDITQTLGWIQSIVTFATDISTGDLGGIVSSGADIYNKLTGNPPGTPVPAGKT